MPTVQIEADLSSEKLLEAAKQLTSSELDEFVEKVINLRAKRIAPSLSHTESELLLKINEGVPDHIQKRLNELRERQRAEILTQDEYSELLQLIDQVENIDAQRVRYLAKLAQLRGKSVRTLMEELGIYPPDHA